MAALLYNMPFMKDKDFVAETAGRKPVTDINSRPVPYNLIKSCINLILRHRVERRGGLIQNDKRRIVIQAPGNGNLLRLSAGYLYALFFQILIKNRIKPLWLRGEPRREPSLLKALYGLFPVIALRTFPSAYRRCFPTLLSASYRYFPAFLSFFRLGAERLGAESVSCPLPAATFSPRLMESSWKS